MNQKDYQLHQNVKKWNIFFIFVFILIGAYFYLTLLDLGKLPHTIPIFDFIILALAVFRMIRLFVYDNIFLFIRETFMDIEITTNTGINQISFVESENSLKRTLYKLSTCPWCIGVWASLCSFFVFYMIPNSYLLFLILAASSLAPFVQLISNNIGWDAEYKKQRMEPK